MKLSISDSTQLKGIALLLLLQHHLFSSRTELYYDVFICGHGIIYELGCISKVCVALFVMLSGYGLGVQYKDKSLNMQAFYKRRFTKLYKNYWLMWILFVPIGLLFFGRTFDAVYENHIYIRLAINFLGFQNFFYFYGYNATWWFISYIIGLYILFPFYVFFEKIHKPLPLLLMSLLLISNIPHIDIITRYLIPFAIGICAARNDLNISKLCIKGGKFALSIILLMTMIWRQYGTFANGVTIDSVLAAEIILLYKSLDVHNYISVFLEFLGKHSMNIFLFHTFIYNYYFQDFIYSNPNPILIYVKLLVVCIVISMAIERLKGTALLRPIFK